jgi:AraC family transcriptional regulator
VIFEVSSLFGQLEFGAEPIRRPDSGLDSSLENLLTGYVVRSGELTIFRMRLIEHDDRTISLPASAEGFLIEVSLLQSHSRRSIHNRESTTFVFEEDAIYIRSLSEPYRAELSGPFDIIVFEMPLLLLRSVSEAAGLTAVRALELPTGEIDPILSNLAKALLPAFESPNAVGQLFIDQLTTAICTHIVHRYGKRSSIKPSKPRKLSRSHETLAKEMLLSNMGRSVSIIKIAHACNLSRGYFIHAFRETTGATPYQWLLNERIVRARMLLTDANAPLSHVAIACGFSDQSHFTRAFTSAVGVAPGAWRRGVK